MAKRKRLSPAQPQYLEGDGRDGLEAKSGFPLGVADSASRPPIAQVAGEAATGAALQELTEEWRQARALGRMIQTLPLDQVVADYLVRDRISPEDEEILGLMESIRTRGQQTPIEVVELEPRRFGLISGLRRLTALRHLFAETGDERFAGVQSLLRKPNSAEDAYLAMVEENEVRVGLSYYERARIVVRATELGVFSDEQVALRRLFAAASRPKRSKIGAFLPICRALDAQLRFPTAISERLGLRLSKAMAKDVEFGRRLSDRLRKAEAETAEAELAVLDRALAPGPIAPVDPPAPPRIHVERTADGCRLTGPGVDAAFLDRLQRWLSAEAHR